MTEKECLHGVWVDAKAFYELQLEVIDVRWCLLCSKVICRVPGTNKTKETEVKGSICPDCSRTMVTRKSLPGETTNPGIYCPVCDY